MQVDKVKAKGYVGIILTALMLAAILGWETIGRKMFIYDDIITLNKEIDKGEVIQEEDLTKTWIEKDSIKTDIINPAQIVGMAAVVDLKPNTPLSSSYLAESSITPTKDEFIFEIPSDWIYGIPSSIRSGDKAYFYQLREGEEMNERFIEQNSADDLNEEDYLFSATIKYARDSGNREVVNAGSDRSSGTGTVSNLEIIATIKEIEELESIIDENSKIIVLYRE